MRRLSALSSQISSGFTLIELLVVIAVMGVLATVVLVAIDPAEQFARAEDSSRKQTVNTLGNSLSSYFAATQTDIAEGDTWITSLVTASEIKSAPEDTTVDCDYTTNTGHQNGYCYNLPTADTGNFVVFTELSSKVEVSVCTSPNVPYFIYDSETGIACTNCGSATIYEPVPNTATGCQP